MIPERICCRRCMELLDRQSMLLEQNHEPGIDERLGRWNMEHDRGGVKAHLGSPHMVEQLDRRLMEAHKRRRVMEPDHLNGCRAIRMRTCHHKDRAAWKPMTGLPIYTSTANKSTNTSPRILLAEQETEQF